MWNTKRPQSPPIRRGIDYLVYAHVLENHNFWAFWPTSANQDLSFEPSLYDLPFTRSKLVETVKRHISTPRPFIWNYNQVSITFRSKCLVRTSWCFEIRCFGAYWLVQPTFGGRIWPKQSKGTYSHQEVSFEPINRSLCPFVKISTSNPYKKAITDGRADRQTDIPILYEVKKAFRLERSFRWKLK